MHGGTDSLSVVFKSMTVTKHEVKLNLGNNNDVHNAKADIDFLKQLVVLCPNSELVSCNFTANAVNNNLNLNSLKSGMRNFS